MKISIPVGIEVRILRSNYSFERVLEIIIFVFTNN